MKAILLAGGKGTRLRPLTLHTPKPIVPIFDRPFLQYQIDLVRQVPAIDEIILSVNYQPDRIEEVLGDGKDLGIRVRYLVEPVPLGTAGAVKYAERFLDDSVVVFNGDVLAQIDLAAVIRQHQARRARATIVLTRVENPVAYGLVETDPDGNVRRFLEKPDPNEITCNTINAGIYVLEPDTLDRIPKETTWSIERSYFPSLIERGEIFSAYVYDGYWIDIGTPAKYRQVHRDIMDGGFAAPPFAGRTDALVWSAPGARIAPGAELVGPCFIDDDAIIERGARILPYAVVGPRCHIAEDAVVEDAILWADSRVGRAAVIRDAIVGRGCRIGPSATVGSQAMIGSESVLSDNSRV